VSLQPKQQAAFAGFLPKPGWVVAVREIGDYSAQKHGVGLVGEVREVEPSSAFPGWLSIVLRLPTGGDWYCAQCRVGMASSRAGRAA
jgi:hypothetical protein